MAKQKAEKSETINTDQDAVLDGFTPVYEEGFEGDVTILEANETVTGLYLGKGRDIGKGQTQNSTHKILDLETGELLLIPSSVVLDKKIEQVGTRDNKRALAFRITYKGKVQPNGGGSAWHDWSLSYRPANEEENKMLPVDFDPEAIWK